MQMILPKRRGLSTIVLWALLTLITAFTGRMANAQTVSLYCRWANDIASIAVDIDYMQGTVTMQYVATDFPAQTVRAQISEFNTQWSLPLLSGQSSPPRYNLNRHTGMLSACGGLRDKGDPQCDDPRECAP